MSVSTFANIFSHSVGCLFVLFVVYLFCLFLFVNFCFYFHYYRIWIKKDIAVIYVKGSSLCFSSKSFIVSSLIFLFNPF